ncbi:MAG: signal peptide peptidase SppA [Pseudomonadota bacterium]|nr:signal peptide peptidase SppA [Pseudomonadota bacterium]
MKRLFQFMMILVLLMFVGGVYLAVTGAFFSVLQPPDKKVEANSILLLKLNGIILSSEKFIKQLNKYGRDDKIKAVVVRIDSPGGAVGASQELYTEVKRFRNETKKPVIISCQNVAASGAYYTAVAGDVIFANAGTLMGSIGVIMEFANLAGLYDWAKIKRYTIQTGPFKDSGAEYRPMREDEKALFQNMINSVHMQFKTAVSESRNIALEKVEPYADGRVFTGESAVSLGFADKIGNLEDAFKEAASRGGIKGKPVIFEPSSWREPMFFKMFKDGDDDEYSEATKVIGKLLRVDLVGMPLFLMPSVLEGGRD